MMIERLQRLHYDFINGTRGGAPAVLIMNEHDRATLDAENARLMHKAGELARVTTFCGAKIVQRVTYAPPFFALHA